MSRGRSGYEIVMEPLKVGLMGLGQDGRALADVLSASSWCKLIAAACENPQWTELFRAEHPEIAVHDDFRSLIVSQPLDALFVAVPPYRRNSYLPIAAERRVPVFMIAPAARRFDEALAVVQAFEAVECPIVVARSWGIEPALQRDALGLEEVGKIFLARGNVTCCRGDELDWRDDSQAAGGGVLLDQAYDLIDMVVQMMGLPSSVYASMAGIARPNSRLPYDTEDTAAVICRYSNGALVTITACWAAGPDDGSVHFYGTSGAIRIDATHVVLTDRTGQTERARFPRSADLLALQVDEFFSTLCSNPLNL
ncbi:MAG: Gfo/Idh/MocA family oxidoreductase, partial [Phycisphaerae bacterium]|nr:Gfo/Idh/MocA family oxidoreductase [Phycisphaerae bacterium]